MERIIKVSGMMCKHCAKNVENACKEVSGVSDAVVSLEDGTVKVLCDESLNLDVLKEAIEKAGKYNCEL